MPNQRSKNKRPLSLQVDKDFKESLQDIANQNGSTVTEIVTLILENYLSLGGNGAHLEKALEVQFERADNIALEYFGMETGPWIHSLTDLANELADMTQQSDNLQRISRAYALKVVSLVFLLIPKHFPKCQRQGI